MTPYDDKMCPKCGTKMEQKYIEAHLYVNADFHVCWTCRIIVDPDDIIIPEGVPSKDEVDTS